MITETSPGLMAMSMPRSTWCSPKNLCTPSIRTSGSVRGRDAVPGVVPWRWGS